jgi:DNA-binding response OmpR family regulator
MLRCLDFFCLPPLYSPTVTDPDDVVRLVVFASAALIVSNLAAYARGQTVSASQRAEVAEDPYRFGRQLAGAATLQHAGKVLTRDFILREIWHNDSDVQYLRIYIRALRQKLELRPERPHYILTDIGVGYRLRSPE